MSRKKYPPNEKTIGGRLRIFREFEGYNIADFAELLEISRGSLSDIENNKTKPSATPINNLVHKTDINIYWLFSGNGERKRKDEFKKVGQSDENPEIAELWKGARKVLKSGNQVAVDALGRNIRYFSHAVETEKEVEDLKSKLGHIEKTMESRLAAMEARFQNDRRKEQRRKRDDGPPDGIERRVLPGRRNGIDNDGSWPDAT